MTHRAPLPPRRASVMALSFVTVAFVSPARAQTNDAIAPVDRNDLALVAPLVARGAVILTHDVDNGVASRPTIFVQVHAPLDTVRNVIATPESYPSFMPAVSDVTMLSRHGARSAFRFHANAALFDVTADTSMHIVNDHRIDVAIAASEFGPSGSRWELFALAPGETIAALTVWTDPSRASWVVRNLSTASGYGASGSNVTVETVLALAVKRRAEILAGATLPIRPARSTHVPPTLEPPAPGPWVAVAEHVNVVVLTLDADGAIQSATAVGATTAPAASMVRRLLDPAGYAGVWPWMRNERIVSQGQGGVRFQLALAAPLAAGHGEVVASTNASRSIVLQDGASGDFAGEQHRWDVFHRDGYTIVMYTSAAEPSHVPLIQRAIMDRDPWAIVGMTAYWNVVTVRFGLAGLI